MQTCRRPYAVKDKDGGIELEVDNEYIMSPKDLMTVNFLDRILNSGVSVLKDRGQRKVTRICKESNLIYREAADACLEGTYTDEKIEAWIAELDSVYNRGGFGMVIIWDVRWANGRSAMGIKPQKRSFF